MDSRTWAVVDLDKLRQNVRNLKERVPGVSILAAVKADAYGHGAREISNTLKEEGIDMLGVASIDEACELKDVGTPIVILSPTSVKNVPKLVQENFIPAVTNYPFAVELNRAARKVNKKIEIHVELDTGMGRTGVHYEEGLRFILALLELKNIRVSGIFTHFPEAEKKDKSFTYEQLKKFKKVLNELARKRIQIPLIHTANTAAILDIPDSYLSADKAGFNMIRPGLLLYGLYPSKNCSNTIKVEPILSLYTRVCQLKSVPPGTSISYGRTYITKKKMKVATLSVGYGDGYPRHLSNKGIVIIKRKRARIIGQVCMDLTMVDVNHINDVEIGDKVTLIGKDSTGGISCDELAELAGTISYEITTNICPRVPRIYVANGKPRRVRSLLGEEDV